MGAHKQGDGQKAGNRAKGKADCRADTRGGSWAGIPKCLIDSPAYRALSLHARAVLVELVARMNGYNNGSIAISQRELVEALGCSPNSVVAALADLMEHGLLDVAADGRWKQRQARLYRLTFVSTKNAGATNDYIHWTPKPKQSGAIAAEAGKAASATAAIAEPRKLDTAAIARIAAARGEVPVEPATAAIPLICKPYPLAPDRPRKGDDGSSVEPPKHGGDRNGRGTVGTVRTCEQCGEPFTLKRADRAYPQRFCSEACRHKAERARHQRRCKGLEEPAPVGGLVNGVLHKLMPVGGHA